MKTFSFRRFSPVFAMAALGSLLVSCGRQAETVPPPPPSQTNAAAAPTVSPELAKLVGKWQRPDEEYVIQIKSVDPSGKLEAAYFNPAPINVSRAAAWRDNGTSRVVIELRDVNYPGCTYKLAYDPAHDQLFGQYYQASMDQTFDVTFARMK